MYNPYDNDNKRMNTPPENDDTNFNPVNKNEEEVTEQATANPFQEKPVEKPYEPVNPFQEKPVEKPYEPVNPFQENPVAKPYNPYQEQPVVNSYNPYEPVNPYQPPQPPQPQQSSYTWQGSSQNRPPLYQQAQPMQAQQMQTQPPQPPQPPVVVPKEKPKKKPNLKILKRVAAFALVCVFSSAITFGVFVAMIQNGLITVESSDTGTTSAFTINKVVDDTSTEITGEVTALSTEEIAEKVLPSVVCVQNYQSTQTYSFFGQQTGESQVELAGEGSGVIMSEDGYILTNAHVVEDATSVTIITYYGDTYDAVVVGSDEVTDLAVLKIEATGLEPAEFGSSSDLSVGETVVAIGNPGGMTFSSSVTVGCVSALDRQIETDDSGYIMTVIQTDAAINPGNSGGALVNQYGQVIGITSSKFVSEGYEGLAFAIPIDDAQPIVSDLQEYGYVVERAVLGISGQYIDATTAAYNGISEGMFVSEITSELAIEGGLEVYDIITAVNGITLTGSGTITSILTSMSAGDTVTLTVDRYQTGEYDLELEITLSQYQVIQ